MKTPFFYLLLLCAMNSCKAQTQKYEFSIFNVNDNIIISSCNDKSIYKPNLLLPKNEAENNDKNSPIKRTIMPSDPMVFMDAKWNGNCLELPYSNISKDEIVELILHITTLTKEQIVIKNNN